MTVGAEAVGSFAVASTNRQILIANAGAIGAAGQDGLAIAGIAVAGVAGSNTLTGQSGTVLAGLVLTAAVGILSCSGQIGSAAIGAVLSGSSGAVFSAGLAGTPVAGLDLVGTVGAVEVTGLSGGAVSGAVLTATAGAVTVSGQFGAVAYSVAARPQHVEIFDLVNVALNDALGTSIRYVRDATTHTLTGTYTEASEVIGMDGHVITTAPQVMIRRNDMPGDAAPRRGEVLSVAGSTFEVYDWRLDDSDAYLIMLKGRYS